MPLFILVPPCARALGVRTEPASRELFCRLARPVVGVEGLGAGLAALGAPPFSPGGRYGSDGRCWRDGPER